MSEVLSVGSSWKGFQSIGRLIIFGDSYSSITHIDYDALSSTPKDPLGCGFPGDGVWNEMGLPNWVGHLITKYRPGPKYSPKERRSSDGDASSEDEQKWSDNPVLVHNYARGGDTIDGVKRQIQRCFLPQLRARTDIQLTAEKTLFGMWNFKSVVSVDLGDDIPVVIWVGINDCGMGIRWETAMEKVLQQLDDLYLVGARNFVLVDVPPVQRTPAVPQNRVDRVEAVVNAWNSDLQQTLKAFVAGHNDTSTFLYSSSAFFNALLDNPVAFGFNAGEVRKMGGDVWIDHIHPTSRVHDLLASDIASFLTDISAVATI